MYVLGRPTSSPMTYRRTIDHTHWIEVGGETADVSPYGWNKRWCQGDASIITARSLGIWQLNKLQKFYTKCANCKGDHRAQVTNDVTKKLREHSPSISSQPLAHAQLYLGNWYNYDRTDESRMYSLWRPALISLSNCTTYSSRAWQVAICTLPAVAVSCVFPTRLMSGPCVSYSTKAIRGSGEIIMGLMRHHTEYQVLFHVSSSKTFHLFRSGSSLKHLHIPLPSSELISCLKRRSVSLSALLWSSNGDLRKAMRCSCSLVWQIHPGFVMMKRFVRNW